METGKKNQNLVFGLDIGTRNVVGTVGYKEEDNFYVMAQYIRQHETRSMLDGQIHDIGRVGNTIRLVKEELEEQTGEKLSEVCIAAAGRVLKTVNTRVEYEFPEESIVTDEHIHTMDLLGIEKAQNILKDKNDTRYKFYCVGYSVVKYYLNDEHFISIEGHKADRIAEDIIVTFLPEDVVDGLYAAVAKAGMEVANLTLEPIAAINVAIPETFRMLNLALVDVGAGTSDICITREGSIIAYGMIPYAGDEITELIVQSYLVDYKTAEKIKLDSGIYEKVEYKDIMGIAHTISADEVWKLTESVCEKITSEVAKKIKELNGDATVAATFVVGGGGKIHGFTDGLADKLGLPQERVALRGEEVLQEVIFEQQDIKKDPLLVTPIGICLNYYEQKNNFIMVHFNGERVKLYDNNKLTIVDAAMEAGFLNDKLFPRRGKEINFTVNGKARIARGEVGESAVIRVNGVQKNINEPLEPNSEIVIEPSTAGKAARCTIEELEEYTKANVNFIVNGKLIVCPKFMEVNGSLEPPFYEIQEGDAVETRGFYTVKQLAEFMDVKIDPSLQIFVNNEPVGEDALVYENFSVEWSVLAQERTQYQEPEEKQTLQDILKDKEEYEYTDTVIGEGAKRQIMQETVKVDAPEEVPEKVLEKVPDEISKEIQLEETKVDEAELSEEIVEPIVEVEVSPEELTAEDTPAQEALIEEAKEVLVETQLEEEIHEILEEVVPPERKAEEQEMAGEDPVPEEIITGKRELTVIVNHNPVVLSGKSEYIFVDVFDFIEFDLSDSRGRAIVTRLNGVNAQYSQKLCQDDRIEIYWKEN